MIRAFLLSILLVPSCWSQSKWNLDQKFPHHEVYEVEPGVVMSARYAASGLVCEMHFEQTHFKKDVAVLWNGLEPAEVDALLDRLVPPSERGQKEDGAFSKGYFISGQAMTKTDTYANVIVYVMSGIETRGKNVTITSATVVEIRWQNRSCS